MKTKEINKMEILVKDKKGKIMKFVYTDKEIYEKMLIRFRVWEDLGKCNIIPQEINDFVKTGIKI